MGSLFSVIKKKFDVKKYKKIISIFEKRRLNYTNARHIYFCHIQEKPNIFKNIISKIV